MKNKQLLVMSLCGLLVVSQPIQTHSDEDNGIGTAVGVGVAAGVVAGGLYALGSWLSSPSTKDVCHDAQNTVNACQAFRPLLSELEVQTEAVPLSRMPSNELQHFINTISEQELLDVANIIGKNGHSAPEYIKQLEQALNRAKKDHKTLLKRMRKVDVGHKFYESMRSLQHEMEYSIENLSIALRYVKKHAEYYNLFAVQQRMLNTYHGEFNLLADYDKYSLANRFSLLVSDVRATYPYIAYVDKIHEGVTVLDRQIAKTYGYPELIKNCINIRNNLATIAHQVQACPEYKRDIQVREQHRLEQERRRLEQERLRMEQERLRLERQRIAAQNQLIAAATANLICGCLSSSHCCHQTHHVVEYVQPAPTYTVVETTTHYTPSSQHVVVHDDYYTIED